LVVMKTLFQKFLAKVGMNPLSWGKVVLYQLSYFRIIHLIIGIYLPTSNFSIAVQR